MISYIPIVIMLIPVIYM